jgi:hypothetical protein
MASPILIAVIATLAGMLAGAGQAQNRTESATATLGRTGGNLTIRTVEDPRRPGTTRRTATLAGSNGVTRTVRLHDGGGVAGDPGLFLFVFTGEPNSDRFRLVSQHDCFDIDPLRATTTACEARRTDCRTWPGETFIGRFDWMNGFDPPHARFTLRFRYLPSYEMICPR